MTQQPESRKTKILRNKSVKVLVDALKNESTPTQTKVDAAVAILQHVIPQQKTTNS